MPLLPGMAIYRALFQLVNEPTSALGPGAVDMLGAAMIGLGLAAGVTLGEFIAAPLRRGTRQRAHVPGVFLRRGHRPLPASTAANQAANQAADQAADQAVDDAEAGVTSEPVVTSGQADRPLSASASSS